MFVCNLLIIFEIIQMFTILRLQLCLFANDKKHNFGGYFI